MPNRIKMDDIWAMVDAGLAQRQRRQTLAILKGAAQLALTTGLVLAGSLAVSGLAEGTTR